MFEQAAQLDERKGDKKNLAIDLGNLANRHRDLGALRAAEANLRREIELCREIEDERNEAIGHQALGRLLTYHGVWEEAEGSWMWRWPCSRSRSMLLGCQRGRLGV